MEHRRWVSIDDNDERIQYSGTWVPANGERFKGRGNFGQVYRNTLHGSNSAGSSLSFNFTGNSVAILGTNDIEIASNGATDPDWDCTLNGTVVAKRDYFQYFENNWFFCEHTDLPVGQHTVGLTVKSKLKTFWFDQIQYRPTEVVQNEVVIVGEDDADLRYSTGWNPAGGLGHTTSLKGSTVTLRFFGTGVTFRSIYSPDLPRISSEASYNIDNNSAVSFAIPAGGEIAGYNTRILDISGLAPQVHTLTMTYQGTESTTPLVVNQFFVENGTNLFAPPDGGSQNPPTPSATNVTPSDKSKVPIGAIVGGVLGGLVFIVILALSAAWYRLRKRSRRNASHGVVQNPLDATPMVHDFQPPSAPVLPIFRPTPMTKSGARRTSNEPSPSPLPTAGTHGRTKRSHIFSGSHNTASGSSGQDRPSTSINTQSTNSRSTPEPTRELTHEDSGIRLSLAPPVIVEYPPSYTPQ